ncbi:hypothetical protein BWQ96_02210 [Gracilariopsis chorda]|uniref:Uncharacterized protein n=1 Tax=Gracilariopsis chorda TaxID=448386 RepID=A0A2V3J0Y9_9FLOR|nr:hypothetical protein BWQ96_02210 [Gracilariopsis chorda]|eukprot:PXF48019.1 hypothetical protein BWQ96_02210 [Gracilariopsis chorda]
MIDLRLGEKLFSGSTPCLLCAAANYAVVPPLDEHGYHAMVCTVGLGATRRHNALQNVLFAVLKQSPLCLHVTGELTFPSQQHLPEVQQQRMDLLIDDTRFNRRPVRLDITVVSPHNDSFLTYASKEAAGAARPAEAQKRTKYDALCATNGTSFNPIGFDVQGGAGPAGKLFFRRLAEYTSSVRGSKPGTEYHTILLRVERTVLQLTAAAVNRRLLSSPQGPTGTPAHPV